MTVRSQAPFRLDRRWTKATGEPHVLIVEGRAQLDADYNTAAADVVEAAYAGGGWDAFVVRACHAMKVRRSSMQVFTEAVFDRTDEKPIVIYVGNAKALARDCGEELVRTAGRNRCSSRCKCRRRRKSWVVRLRGP